LDRGNEIKLGLSPDERLSLKLTFDEVLAQSERLFAVSCKLEGIKEEQVRQGNVLAEILELSKRQKLSDEERERTIREKIEAEYADKLAQEHNAREAAERAARAVLDVSDVPGLESDLRERGGQAIVDALLQRVAAPAAVTIEIHRKIAEWAHLIGNIPQ